jgi:hypothetical protein
MDEIFKNMKVLRSISGKHPEFGYPLRELLCPDGDDLKAVIEQWASEGISDIAIETYADAINRHNG